MRMPQKFRERTNSVASLACEDYASVYALAHPTECVQARRSLGDDADRTACEVTSLTVASDSARKYQVRAIADVRASSASLLTG
jgi:hypothetical protein